MTGKPIQALEAFSISFAILVGGMEERFLPLGGDLTQIVQSLQRLTTTAERGFGALRESISSGPLGQLGLEADSLPEILQRQLGGFAGRLKPLSHVSEDLLQLRWLATDIQRIGVFLQACSTNFAVESARREESRQAFASFVGEMRALASRIGALANQMNDDAGATLAKLNAARRHISGNLTTLEQLAQTMQRAWRTAAGEIRQLLAETRTTLDRVEHHRLAINAHAQAVVYYLQFGDLTRQKCEHVLATVQDAGGAASNLASSGDPMPTISCLAKIALTQLDLIQDEVDEARSRLSNGYSSLESELKQLTECGGQWKDSETRTGETSAWDRLKERLGELQIVEREDARLNQDAIRAVGEAGAAATQLHGALENVRSMSSQLHLLALNAIIQTGHLGKNGRTLEELAQHVDQMHRDCDQLVPAVLTLIEGIGKRTSTFIDDSADPDRSQFDGLSDLEISRQKSTLVMNEVCQLAGSSEDMLREAMRRLDTLNDLSAEITGYRKAMRDICASLPAPMSTPETEALEKRALQRYTMQSERMAHSSGGAGDDEIELFSDKPADADPAMAGSLGDNIELF